MKRMEKMISHSGGLWRSGEQVKEQLGLGLTLEVDV